MAERGLLVSRAPHNHAKVVASGAGPLSFFSTFQLRNVITKTAMAPTVMPKTHRVLRRLPTFGIETNMEMMGATNLRS
jgi:hypothetical protein